MRRVVLAAAIVVLVLGAGGCIVVDPGTVRTGVSGDMVVFGANAEVPRGTVVNGSAVVVGGRLDVAGEVRREVVVLGGDILIRSTGKVGGDIVSLGGSVRRETGATVTGSTITLLGMHHWSLPQIPSLPLFPTLPVVHRFWFYPWRVPLPRASWVGLLVLALVITALWGRNVRQASEAMAREPGRSALLGLLGIVLAPMALLVLLFTVLGIPLIPVVIAALVVAYLFGYTALADLLGNSILKLLNITYTGPYWPVVTGVVALGLVRLVPVAATIVAIAVTLVGLGGALATRFGTRQPWLPEPAAGGDES